MNRNIKKIKIFKFYRPIIRWFPIFKLPGYFQKIRSSEDWKALAHFASYFLEYRKTLLFSLLTVPITTFATVAIPWLIVKATEQFTLYSNLEQLKYWVIWFVVAIIVGAVFEFFFTFSLQYIVQRSIFSMRQDLFKHILFLPRIFFDKQTLGGILTRITSDFENVGESLAVGVLSLFIDLIKTIFLFLLLFFLNAKLALLVTLFLPLILGVMQLVRFLLRKSYTKARTALAVSTGYLQECIQGIQTIQLYLAEERILKTYTHKNYEFSSEQKKINWYESSLFSFMEGISVIAVAAVLWYSTDLVGKNILTVSVIVGFINALQRCFIPIRELTQQLPVIQRAVSSLAHIEFLFEQDKEREPVFEEHQKLENLESVVFEHVKFRYSEKDRYILNDVSFKVTKGKKIALVGSTGSGKTTIFRLLTKQYENYEGSIRINNIELADIPRNVLSKLFSIMNQDVFLFNESIAFNIHLANPTITQSDVEKASSFVSAHKFIDELQEKYNFCITENGKNLSSGQAQLIALARVIAQKKEIFLLDEATSAIDSVTEKNIETAIQKIFKEKTVLAIAHRLSTIYHSDEILYLHNGEIVEKGSHHQLMDLNGFYYNLIKKNTDGF